MTKKTVMTAVVVTLVGGGLLGTGYAFAQAPSPNGGPSLVQMIASKFNLKTSDVQSVFNQYRTEKQQTAETNYENYLTQLVSQGKITNTQKTLLINKHKEILSQRKNEMQNLKSMTPKERRQEMQTERQNLQNWATQNNIPLQYLFGGFGPRGHFGGRW